MGHVGVPLMLRPPPPPQALNQASMPPEVVDQVAHSLFITRPIFDPDRCGMGMGGGGHMCTHTYPVTHACLCTHGFDTCTHAFTDPPSPPSPPPPSGTQRRPSSLGERRWMMLSTWGCIVLAWCGGGCMGGDTTCLLTSCLVGGWV